MFVQINIIDNSKSGTEAPLGIFSSKSASNLKKYRYLPT